MSNKNSENESKQLLRTYTGKSLTSSAQVKDFLNSFFKTKDILHIHYPDLGWNEIKSIDSQEGFLRIEDSVRIHLLSIKNFHVNKFSYEDIESWYFFIETNSNTTNIKRPINQYDYRYTPFQYWSDSIAEKLPYSEYSSEDVFTYDPDTGKETLISQVYDLYAKPINGESFIITFKYSMAEKVLEKVNKYPLNYSNSEYLKIIGLD